MVHASTLGVEGLLFLPATLPPLGQGLKYSPGSQFYGYLMWKANVDTDSYHSNS